MSVIPTIRIQALDFSVEGELAALTKSRTDTGAVVTFVGLCRDEGGRLGCLEIEAYPQMAHKEIARVAAQALVRWPLTGLTILHRFGRISPGEKIVLVAAASIHRQTAFAAGEFIMDYLKTSAPFWKREHDKDGKAGTWVSANAADDEALARWN